MVLETLPGIRQGLPVEHEALAVNPNPQVQIASPHRPDWVGNILADISSGKISDVLLCGMGRIRGRQKECQSHCPGTAWAREVLPSFPRGEKISKDSLNAQWQTKI